MPLVRVAQRRDDPHSHAFGFRQHLGVPVPAVGFTVDRGRPHGRLLGRHEQRDVRGFLVVEVGEHDHGVAVHQILAWDPAQVEGDIRVVLEVGSQHSAHGEHLLMVMVARHDDHMDRRDVVEVIDRPNHSFFRGDVSLMPKSINILRSTRRRGISPVIDV